MSRKTAQIELIVFYLLFSFVIMGIILFMSSCKPSEELQRSRAQQFYALHPSELAQNCADKFPPKITPGKTIVKSDTVTLKGDSIICPTDTVRLPGRVVKVKCPDSRIIHDTISKTDTIENFARIYLLQADTAAKGHAVRQTTAERDKARKQAKNGLIGLIIIGVVISGLAIKKIT